MKRNIFSILIGGFLIAGFIFSYDAYSQEPFTKGWEVELKYTSYYGLVNDIYVEDINGDRNPEVLLASVFNGASSSGGPGARGRLVALDASGKELWWYETDRGRVHPFVGVAASDVDGDGLKDIVLEAYDIEVLNPKSSLWGDPDGTTRLTNAKKTFFKTERQPQALDVGDIDSDGNNEIIFGVKGSESQTSSEWYVYCLYKGGKAEKWTHKVKGPPQKIIIADMNNDGAQELIVVTTNNLYLLDKDGDETWMYYQNEQFKDISVYDMDGDGTRDIIAAVGVKDIVVYSSKDGKPTGKKIKTLVEPTTLIVDDANGDGVPEIFYTGMKSALIIVDPSGTELQKIVDLRGTFAHSLVLADMNRDGRKDMIFAADNSKAGNVEVSTPTGVVLHSTVYVYYNTMPSTAVQQVESETVARDYFDLAEGYYGAQQYEKAREYYIKARDAYAKVKNQEMVSRCNARLEEIASLQGQEGETTQTAEAEEPKESGVGALLFLIVCLAVIGRSSIKGKRHDRK